MNTMKKLQLPPVAAGALALIAVAVLPTAGRAEDPSPKCRVCVAQETAVPVLSRIPYLGRLFKSVNYQEGERIGVDFDFEISPECPQDCKAGVSAGVCQPAARPQLFVIRKTVHGQTISTCCKDEPCCGKDCQEASACCEDGCEIICEEEECNGLSWERIVELTAHNSALEATLEAREELQEARAEMMEHFAEVLVEKAKLEAKVESLAHQAELTKEMLTLVAENSRLKAQAEAAENKLTLVHEMAKLAIENEQLKLAARSRAVPAQLSNDVEYLPPAPTTRTSPAAPTKKASFQQPAQSEAYPDLTPSR